MTVPYQPLVDVWNERHADALERIERYYNDDNDDNDDVRILSRFLIDRQENAYSFLPGGLASRLFTAEGAAGLLQTASHALVDDGEITFVLVGNCPMIDFCHRDEIDLDRLASEAQKIVAKKRGVDVSVRFIPDAAGFVAIAEAYVTMTEARLELHHRMRGDELESRWSAEKAAEYRLRSEELARTYEDVVAGVLSSASPRPR